MGVIAGADLAESEDLEHRPQPGQHAIPAIEALGLFRTIGLPLGAGWIISAFSRRIRVRGSAQYAHVTVLRVLQPVRGSYGRSFADDVVRQCWSRRDIGSSRPSGVCAAFSSTARNKRVDVMTTSGLFAETEARAKGEHCGRPNLCGTAIRLGAEAISDLPDGMSRRTWQHHSGLSD